jgi:hypothetical protein
MDEYTPDAWFDLLEDLPFDIAKAAVVRLAKRQPWVAPAEIRAEANELWREQQPPRPALAAVPEPAITEGEAADAKRRGLAPLRQILADLNLRRRA